MKYKVFKYYLSSIITLFTHTSFFKIPLVLLFDKVLFRVEDKYFYVKNLMDIWTLKEVIIDDCYKVRKFDLNNKVVLDIGSSIGDFYINAVKSGTSKVYAYEINENRCELMKKNMKLNCPKTIELYRYKVKLLDDIFKK